MGNPCDMEFQQLSRENGISNMILFFIGLALAVITIMNIFQAFAMFNMFKLLYSYIDPPLTGIGAIAVLFITFRNYRNNTRIYHKFCT